MSATSWKTWAGRLALVVLPPLLLLASLEIACRGFSWGYPTSFLVADKIGNREVWRTNEFYGYRFFQPLMARSPAPIMIDREKPEGVKRVAVLGESAAMGDPLIEFSLARALDKTLNTPGQPQRYEVINAGVTAISSAVVVDIARDLAKADIDIFVVYTGNNELVGPYAPDQDGPLALDVFPARRAQSSDRSPLHALRRWLDPLHLSWTRTRLASAIQALQSSASPGKHWDGLTMFAENRILASDPRMSRVYANYESNLERIAGIAQRHGIQAIFCTMAVNLSDCPPFGSAHGRALGSEEKEAWQHAATAGKAALQAGGVADAQKSFDAAMQIDPGHAELNYMAAVAAEKSGDNDAAAQHYRRARDLDTLRVRADSRMNTIIRNVADRHGMPLVESEKALGAAPGAESFVDHVHFSMEGVGLLAGAVAATIEQTDDHALLRPDPPTIAARMGYDQWSQSKLASVILQRLEHAPFRDQQGNSERITTWREKRQAAQAALTAEPPGAALAHLSKERANYPWDGEYAVQAMHRLAGTGAWSQAAEMADKIRPQLRGASALCGLVALVYAKDGRANDAAAVLVSTGPPYGYFLFDATLQLLGTLEEMGEIETARAVAQKIMADAHDFPGRLAIEHWQRQTSR